MGIQVICELLLGLVTDLAAAPSQLELVKTVLAMVIELL